jgi:hypothetical protein
MKKQTLGRNVPLAALRGAEVLGGAVVVLAIVALFGLAAATAALDVARLMTAAGITPA